MIKGFNLIAAVDPDGLLGRANGDLPWHYPKDVQHFHTTVEKKPLIVGRKTYYTLPQHLIEGHPVFVFTKKGLTSPNRWAIPVGSLEEFMEAFAHHKTLHAEDSYVIGGAEIYELFFRHKLISKAIMTHIHLAYKPLAGDAHFPMSYLRALPSKIATKDPDFTITEYTIDS
jgi:dihydrofolate reductase